MNFRLPDDLTKAIEAAIAREKTRNGEANRSAIIRRALRIGLQNLEADDRATRCIMER